MQIQYCMIKMIKKLIITITYIIHCTNNDRIQYIQDTSGRSPYNEYSDATLLIYNSSFNEIAKVNFKDVFPVGLSAVNFDATKEDIEYATATATFKYSIYDIEVIT